eukprot:1406434-Rhodomonas_salina.1
MEGGTEGGEGGIGRKGADRDFVVEKESELADSLRALQHCAELRAVADREGDCKSVPARFGGAKARAPAFAHLHKRGVVVQLGCVVRLETCGA